MVFVRTLPSHVLPPMKYSLPDSLPCEEAGLSTKDLTPSLTPSHAHYRTHGARNLEGVCGPGRGLTQGTVADEPGEVGCVCGAGTLFRIARSDHSLDLCRLISRTEIGRAHV